MLLSFDYIGYKRLSENKRFPNHRWYSDATWGEHGWMVSINLSRTFFTGIGHVLEYIDQVLKIHSF
jgi:hypothetical protein